MNSRRMLAGQKLSGNWQKLQSPDFLWTEDLQLNPVLYGCLSVATPCVNGDPTKGAHEVPPLQYSE